MDRNKGREENEERYREKEREMVEEWKSGQKEIKEEIGGKRARE
jgi:hypothetical protein